MSNADKWKQEAVKVLEELKHRPSKEARSRAELLLVCAQNGLLPGQADRRVTELRKAITRYDRNTARR
jgi:hypothetical protein